MNRRKEQIKQQNIKIIIGNKKQKRKQKEKIARMWADPCGGVYTGAQESCGGGFDSQRARYRATPGPCEVLKL